MILDRLVATTLEIRTTYNSTQDQSNKENINFKTRFTTLNSVIYHF